MPVFTPPTVDDVPPVYAGRDRYLPVPFVSQMLFRHYKQRARGRTVIKLDGEWFTIDVPTVEEMDLAEAVYLGGHVYTVTDAEAAELTAAGYGAFLS